MTEVDKLVKFQPFTSNVNVSFWHELGRRKLEIFKLSEEPVTIYGYYGIDTQNDLPSYFYLSLESFETDFKPPAGYFKAIGTLYNTNTIENFKSLNKQLLFDKTAQMIWEDIRSGRYLDEPHLLTRFLLTSFADLKKFIFYYHFAFPALIPKQLATLDSEPQPISDILSSTQIEELKRQFAKLREVNIPFFLIKVNTSDASLHIAPLKDLITFWECDSSKATMMLGVADPCTHSRALGWNVRNLLFALQFTFHDKKINAFKENRLRVLSYRHQRKPNGNVANPELSSLVFTLILPPYEESQDVPKATGWERDSDNKLKTRIVNLSQAMDPVRLISSAAELNLKLMSWRQFGSLQLNVVQNTKCLLLGAGTLGCNIARNLIAWGIRHITFVDNSRVSYSNPVRQSLYILEDCLNGGAFKALAAAKRLKDVFPPLETKGIVTTIPMPGHLITSTEDINDTKQSVKLLEELVDTHDVIFLLTDSRESRWLPTLLCAAKRKLAINVALGFDTFVVMRHGINESDTPSSHEEYVIKNANSRLGCYFCNDVIAPTDSLHDRTLDQQCTVTRPGLSSVASALAVELLISILHHPLKGKAPADERTKDSTTQLSSELGLIPHQIRGFMSQYNNLLVTGLQYDKCVACSSPIINEYKKRGVEFLLEVFNKPTLLEDITGLTQMKQEAANINVEWEVDSSNDDF